MRKNNHKKKVKHNKEDSAKVSSCSKVLREEQISSTIESDTHTFTIPTVNEILQEMADKNEKTTKETQDVCAQLGKCKTVESKLGIVVQLILDVRDSIKKSNTAAVEALNEVKNLKLEVKSLKEKLKECDERCKKLEIASRSNNILIKGIPLHPQTGQNETPSQTAEMVQNFLQKLKVDPGFTWTQASRFKVNETAQNRQASQGKQYTPVVKLVLPNSSAKQHIFSKIARRDKDAALKAIRISNDYPDFLLGKLKDLEKEAFLARQADKSLRTRIVLKGADLALEKSQKNRA